MRATASSHAGTVHSELFALNNGRTNWDGRTVVMVDEAAMLDTKLMAELTAAAQDAGAKLILVGDDRQLASIDRGGMFGALKDRYGAAELSEVTRQHKDEDRRAATMMAEGNFADALWHLSRRRARSTGRARRTRRAPRWSSNGRRTAPPRPTKSRFVFAYTNADVDSSSTPHSARCAAQRGELGADHMLPTADGWQRFAAGDRIQFTGTDKKVGFYNGAAGTVTGIDGTENHRAARRQARRRQELSTPTDFRHSATAMPARSIAGRGGRSIKPISIIRSIGARRRAMSR